MYHRTVKPKKSLGQHFLKDLSVAEKIASILPQSPDMPVLEIGPGTGVLTRFLQQRHSNLTVVELDRDSVQFLNKNFPALQGKIIETDFLKIDLNKTFQTPFMVIGNYPYNISSQIFFKVLEYKDLIPYCGGMVQKEVAERLASKPGKKSYGIISALLQAWYDIELLFEVGPEVFDPPPKVRSAVILMKRNSRTELGCDSEKFRTVVKTAFNQRRKTLRNSLKSLIGDRSEIASLPVFDRRPEQLSVEEFVELTNITS